MNAFEKILTALQYEIERPKSYGAFHLVCVAISIIVIIYLFIRKEKDHEKSLKRVLLIYGIIALILEILKQVVWSFNPDTLSWDYQWYAAPFQLCTMPIYISLICAFLKKGKVRDSMLSFLAFTTILGSLATIFYPESCFVRTLLVDIHTMYLHLGSFVVSVYLLTSKEVKLEYKSLINGYIIFLICASIALFMDTLFYKLNIINNETFNMFYISPYFTSSLPVFDIVYQKVPYLVFLLFYLVMIFIGSSIIYLISKLISKNRK